MDYKKIYKRLCKTRKTRGLEPEKGFEIHHIKPRSFGGSDKKCNLVKLTYREHYVAHKLLVRFSKGDEYYKMRHAFYFMSHKQGKKYNSSYFYSKYKEELLKDKPYVGSYLINPAVLPSPIKTSNNLEELFCRLVNRNIERFIIPQVKRYYPNGTWSMYFKYLKRLRDTGMVVTTSTWGGFSVYSFTKKGKELFASISEGITYKPRHLRYDDHTFETKDLKNATCSLSGITFKNPLTLRTRITPSEIKPTITREEVTAPIHKDAVFLEINNRSCENLDQSLIDEYKEFYNISRFHTDKTYPLLKSLNDLSFSADHIHIDLRDRDICKSLYLKIIRFICNRRGFVYKPSTCCKGGVMSYPLLTKEIQE